ncbi:MAG: isocitrate/isopropylmalate dehydrogenase family protein [Rhodospirillaceae bacterium]|jgi:isocitrate/isopropylmalate dehydrogenase|nr:isocitrate/isopropylmalate dehydrogenase family protein [Rhodospirillaceae bacterium]MBT3808636.1 isocitrate/isopropylmalate dehydrogenase family protein [Rhodospirillaceae bacterium]MBT3932518.1 isocitrate/isopropylmalate dehydrogenase family protein [Rhodospirillaceae bacterium]MBT4772321.1 isocitrate/isopropylmalate dehydrogenase family protein [Rhodospirillaceae bacterium]MBT5359608.1 isocitrate/isopropylmalate dehydrogenase family protein [Rhodospirillaceae bacterium]
MPKTHSICVLPGDGIGEEVIDCARRVLDALTAAGGPGFSFETHPAGHGTFLETGHAMPESSMAASKAADAVLVGAMDVAQIPPQGGDPLGDLRIGLEVAASVRPSRVIPGVVSPADDIDCLVVREVTEGLYSRDEYMHDEDTAYAVRVITREASTRAARMAFEQARMRKAARAASGSTKPTRVTSVHKVGVLKLSDGLFLEVCAGVAQDYPDIEYETRNVDACALELVREPGHYDVILATNVFGDILSDVAAGLAAGLGLAPSACIGERWAYFEPVHGTAPDIAGRGIANPCATILTAAMMLRYLGEDDSADAVDQAVYGVLARGDVRTGDLGGTATSTEMTDAIVAALDAAAQ